MSVWKLQAKMLAAQKVGGEPAYSKRQIAEMLGVPKSTVCDYLKKLEKDSEVSRSKDKYKDGKDNSRILVISDMHIPYHYEGLLPFLEGLKKKYKPTRVVCVGDELDKHAMSFHDSDPDLDSAGKELERALPTIAKLHKLFPEIDFLESNHGSMVFRKAHHHGIPRKYIKSYNDVLQVGEGWVWHMDLTLELPDRQLVYFHHGKSQEAIKTSQLMGMSHVCGHYHEQFGVKYWANPLGLYWGMNVGCLIDDKSMAFAYNKVNNKRPIIGTGLIIDGVPVLEAVKL